MHIELDITGSKIKYEYSELRFMLFCFHEVLLQVFCGSRKGICFFTIIHHTSALTTQEVLEIAVFICEPFEAQDLVSILFMHRLSLPCRSG